MTILKRLFLLICLSVPLTGLYAQKLNFFQGTFEEAKAAAKKQDKLIYLMVEWGDNSGPYSPIPLDEELLKAYNSGFICIFKNTKPKDGLNGIYQQYNISRYPTHLYLDQDGVLLLKGIGSRSDKQPYLRELEKAKRLAKAENLGTFAREYQKGNRDEQFLKRYLLKYEELDIAVDQDVLEAYANLLPVNKLDDFETVSFLIQRGAALSTTAYKISRINPKLVDSVYKSLPYEKRVIINNRTINASMARAKQQKDEKLALQTASFTQSTWNNDWQRGMYAYSGKMMEYYKAVNDTAKYLRSANTYYQQYYLSLRDSIHQPEVPRTPGAPPAQVSQQHFPIAPKSASVASSNHKTDSATLVKQSLVVMTVGTPVMGISNIAPKSQYGKAMDYAMTLNNGAWTIYESRTTNPQYLSQAVTWSWRSIELFPDNPAYHDTLAHLLYQQKKYNEAISHEQKAMILLKTQAEKVLNMSKSGQIPKKAAEASQKGADVYKAEMEKMQLRTL